MISNFYQGHWIVEPVSNNAFSYQERQVKKIFVASFISGTLKDLAVGEHIVFDEIFNGQEQKCVGLKHFVHWQKDGKDIYIFDNHNHAFFCWLSALDSGALKVGAHLVHVDQHKDMREPPVNFLDHFGSRIDLSQTFHYTNNILNVGNFIKPALKMGLFSGVTIVDNGEGFNQDFLAPYVLDIDCDIFADVMDYIPENVKLKAIRRWVQDARIITIATSPYFMDQQKAIDYIYKIFT